MRSALLMAPLLSLAVASGALAEAKKASPFFPFPMKVDRLPNGMTVVRIPFSSPGLIAYYTAMRVGSRNEVEPGHTGFAHFFEHMMFKGTPRFPEGEREKLIGKHGFDDNAYTGDDVTVYHSTGPSSALEALVEVEADRFQHLAYSEASFQTEAKAVLGEYHKSAANPELKIEEVLAATAFTRHTYQHTTIGFYDDIKRMPEQYEYSKSFFQRWYTPDNATLVVVGDFDDARLMERVKKHYARWASKSAQVAIPAEPPQTQERTAHIDWNTPTLPRHVFAWHTPSGNLADPAMRIQFVLAAYLAGTTSPLYKELVLEKQLVEELTGLYDEHRDPNLFILSALLKDEQHRPAVSAAFDRAVSELASGKVDRARVDAIKSNLRYQLLMALETPDQVANAIARRAASFGDPRALILQQEGIAKVRPEQLVAFAKKYLVRTNRTVLTLASKPRHEAAPAGGAR